MSTPKIPKIPMPGISIGQMPNALPLASFNPNMFHKMIQEMGIRMIHSRPIPSPFVKDVRGVDADPGDNRQENGFIYYGHKEFIGTFMSISFDKNIVNNGQYDIDGASVILPTKYMDGTDCDFQIFDRIEAPGLPARYYQRVEHSQTGIDLLHFPATKIDYLRDSNDRLYTSGIDFSVVNGNIQWITGGKRPGFDPLLGTGDIYSVNYYLTPVFTLLSLPHQFRVTQTNEGVLGKDFNIVTRFPQLGFLRKDYIPADPNDTIGQNDSHEPMDGSVRGGV